MGHLIRVTFPVPPLSCNCTILGDAETREAVVIDPGGDPDRIRTVIQERGFRVVMILHTHAHFDHFLASGDIQAATGAPLCLHESDGMLWAMLETQCRLFGVPYVPAPPPDRWLRDEECFRVGAAEGHVLHTPGHTPGSLCFHFHRERLLFSGDTLFRGGIGRTDLWGGDFHAIERSIRERLYALTEETVVIPGHGPETLIGLERESNPFVRGDR